jgi:hypothetical protein
VNRIRKRSLRNLAAMALSGTPEVTDAGLVLSHSLGQLRLNVDTLVRSIELGGLDANELQSHLIGLQHRFAALEDFTDECLEVAYLPLDDEDDDTSQGPVPS